jgi:hypothetical protein
MGERVRLRRMLRKRHGGVLEAKAAMRLAENYAFAMTPRQAFRLLRRALRVVERWPVPEALAWMPRLAALCADIANAAHGRPGVPRPGLVSVGDLDLFFVDNDTVTTVAVKDAGLISESSSEAWLIGAGDLTKRLVVSLECVLPYAEHKILAAGGRVVTGHARHRYPDGSRATPTTTTTTSATTGSAIANRAQGFAEVRTFDDQGQVTSETDKKG